MTRDDPPYWGWAEPLDGERNPHEPANYSLPLRCVLCYDYWPCMDSSIMQRALRRRNEEFGIRPAGPGNE